MTRAFLIVTLTIGSLLTAVPSGATVLLSSDFTDLVTHAEAIVHGRVVDVEPRWVEGRRRIESVVTLAVSEYLKGELGDTVAFRVPGGELGLYRSIFVGAPVFALGDEVVVFLSVRGPAIPWLLGLSQGVFRVRTSEATGAKLVQPPIVAVREQRAERIVRGDSSRRPVSVTEFAEEVRRITKTLPLRARPGRGR